MSKATVVSVCNYPIGPEFKPGLHPSDYSIPAAENEDTPAVLVIEDGFHDIHLLDYKTMRVTVPSAEIARAVVEDYKIAQLQIADNALPGLFYVDGEYEPIEAVNEFPKLVGNARVQHRNWCNRLVKMADDLWQLSKRHRHISTTMINAASYLKLEREWSKEHMPEDLAKCPGCASLVPAEAAVCRFCTTIINKAAYSNLTFAEK